MPKITSYEHGTFSWVELATTDADAAKKFYGGLFGWTYDDMPAGPDMIYSMAKIGDAHVAALYKKGAEMKDVPTHWASYITVNNVDETAKKATANGGKLMKEPFDVMDVGRMAVVQDPTGATFCIWQAKKHIGAGLKQDPGSLCWNELYTNDVDRAGKFYINTIGWTTKGVDMGPMGMYTLFNRPGDDKNNAGGMMNMPPNMKGAPPNWLAYFAVKSCDESTKKAESLGAKVLMPGMDIPNIGRFSIVQDPTGGVFALYQGAH